MPSENPNGSPFSLEREARVFARHLIGEELPDELSHRYGRACKLFFAGESIGGGDGVVPFALRHPWSIGFLDAGCGLVAREHPLRRRLLCLTAILEANTEYTGHFLPPRRGTALAFLVVVVAGVIGVGKSLLGVPLLFMVRVR